ncbi:MAG: class I SAM-dependent methyltransferase [Bacteroidia bacterium]|nr:class I SAM-dependent methyltransferase [Bacteroidia bacterium]
MNWYNLFSSFYDLSIEGIYKKSRQEVFSMLATEHVSCVLDLACGTGQNFPHLVERFGTETQILGIDLSPGMLAKAQKRIDKKGWENVSLLEVDARQLNQEAIDAHLGKATPIHCIVSTLALVVIPNWEKVFHTLFDLLSPGGQFLMMEVYAKRKVPQTYYTDLIARADLKRKVWEPLEKVSERFDRKELKGSPHLHGGTLYVASGFKKVL